MKKILITLCAICCTLFTVSAQTKADSLKADSIFKSLELQGVEVVKQKSLVKSDIDKITYNIEDDPDSKSNSILEMLRKVPMVTVDGEENIQVNGSSSFKVYVNNKPNQTPIIGKYKRYITPLEISRLYGFKDLKLKPDDDKQSEGSAQEHARQFHQAH